MYINSYKGSIGKDPQTVILKKKVLGRRPSIQEILVISEVFVI